MVSIIRGKSRKVFKSCNDAELEAMQIGAALGNKMTNAPIVSLVYSKWSISLEDMK